MIEPEEHQGGRVPGAAWVLATSLATAVLAAALHLTISFFAAKLLTRRIGAPLFDGENFAPEVLGNLSNLTLLLLPSQIALALLAWVLASRAPNGAQDALGLRAPRASSGQLLLVAWAMPTAALVGALLVWIVAGDRESVTLRAISRLIAAQDTPAGILAMAAMVVLAPAIAEELFFRGWMQRRLERAVGPALAIGLSSLAFGLMHLDVVQSVAVLPASVLLGYVTWRTGSLWPAMLGHAAFNALGFVGTRMATEDGVPEFTLGAQILASFVLAAPVALAVLVFQLEWRARRGA